jgi:hypothetical protein
MKHNEELFELASKGNTSPSVGLVEIGPEQALPVLDDGINEVSPVDHLAGPAVGSDMENRARRISSHISRLFGAGNGTKQSIHKNSVGYFP